MAPMIPPTSQPVPAWRSALVGALLLAACSRDRDASTVPPAGAPSPPAAQAEPAAAAPRIVVVGTSLTAGLGLADPSLAYPGLIQQKIDSAGLHYRVVNAGVSGETSAGALRRIDWVLKEPAAMVLVETGANDGLRGLDPDTLAANLHAILARIKQQSPAPRVVLVGMRALPNMGAAYVRRFEAVYPAVAKAEGVPFVPFLLDGVAGIERLNQADGVHPTPEGQRIAAANVWRILGPLLGAAVR